PNLLGSSAKGNEYFLRHLLGTDNAVRVTEAPPDARPQDVVWRDEAPTGKLHLLPSLDFRMTPRPCTPRRCYRRSPGTRSTTRTPLTCTCSCSRFNPAIVPPRQTRTDWDTFMAHRTRVQRAGPHPPRHPHRR